LCEFSETIEKYFETHPPQSISETAAKIEKLTGLKKGVRASFESGKKRGKDCLFR
jgi:hypothetical protein